MAAAPELVRGAQGGGTTTNNNNNHNTNTDNKTHNNGNNANRRRHCPEPLVFARVFHMLSMVEIWILGVSLFACLYATYVEPLPGAVRLCSKDYVLIFQLTSFAIALLMIFRTNTAYARWWEARTAVGRWLNCVRNAQRLMLTHTAAAAAAEVDGGGGSDGRERGDGDRGSGGAKGAVAGAAAAKAAAADAAALAREFARWNAALTAAACAYLCRKRAYLDAHCRDLLTCDELEWLAGCDNPPVKVLAVLSELVCR